MARPATSSVSKRGTKTPGPTESSSRRNPALPVRCCSGTRRARSATRSSSPSGACAPVTISLRTSLVVVPMTCAARVTA